MRRGKHRKKPGDRVLALAIGLAGSLLVRALYATVRIREQGLGNLERARALRPGGSVIYAIWHGRLLGNCFINRNQGICVMVSRHRDGEIIARIIERLGFLTARGSSTRGSTAALKNMLNILDRGHDLGFTVDGPRGPRGVVKPGVVYAAARSGAPIVPLSVGYSSCWSLKSWDRFQVPKPFASMVVTYGPSVPVPPEPDERSAAEYCTKIGLGIDRVARWADNLARPIEKFPGRAVARRAESFLTRERDRWYHLPVLLLLWPIELAYWLCWYLRETFYRAGLLKQRSPGAPTLCVGSLHMGGAGKTPLTILLAGLLEAKGLRVAVLAGGYGAGGAGSTEINVVFGGRIGPGQAAKVAAAVGDEAALLALKLPGVGIVAGPDRVAAARVALDQLGAQVLVLDDGFGHRRLARNIDLLLFNDRLLGMTRHLPPLGFLREPYRAAKRARALIYAGSGEPPRRGWDPLKLINRAGQGQVIHLRRKADRVFRFGDWLEAGFGSGGQGLSASIQAEKALAGKKVLAFCAVASPGDFRDQLASCDPASLTVTSFGDHYVYSAGCQQDLARRAEAESAVLITTEKDAVKLDPALIGTNLLVLVLALEPEKRADLEELLDELLA